MSNIFWYESSFASEDFSISSWKDTETSRANLENLSPLLPINLERNIDLVSIAANGANPNLVNKNDDGIDSKTAAEIIDLLIHKPINIEHNQKKIVGHILTSGFSSMETSEIISTVDAINSVDPINMSFGGVIYKKIHPELVKLLEANSDSDSPYFKSLSTSWEIMFSDFHILLGSRKMKEAEKVTDSKQKNELKKHLRKYGGTGKLKDGTPVYRQVFGPSVLPVGFGIVSNPGAFVKGILTKGADKKETANSKFLELFKNKK